MIWQPAAAVAAAAGHMQLERDAKREELEREGEKREWKTEEKEDDIDDDARGGVAATPRLNHN